MTLDYTYTGRSTPANNPSTQRAPNLLLWLKTKPRYQVGHMIAPESGSSGLRADKFLNNTRARGRASKDSRGLRVTL